MSQKEIREGIPKQAKRDVRDTKHLLVESLYR